MKQYGSVETQKFSSATRNEKCVSHTEKVENILTKISHKIFCDTHMTVFTV